MQGPVQEQALEADFEIIDLDLEKKSSQLFNQWLDGQRFSLKARFSMTFLTILGVILLSWLLITPLHSIIASHPASVSSEPSFINANSAPSGYTQMLVVHNVIYLIDHDGLVRAIWTRKKFVFQLWYRYVTPSSKFLKIEHNIVYLSSPDGSIVALRAHDGTVLWRKKGR